MNRDRPLFSLGMLALIVSGAITLCTWRAQLTAKISIVLYLESWLLAVGILLLSFATFSGTLYSERIVTRLAQEKVGEFVSRWRRLSFVFVYGITGVFGLFLCYVWEQTWIVPLPFSLGDDGSHRLSRSEEH